MRYPCLRTRSSRAFVHAVHAGIATMLSLTGLLFVTAPAHAASTMTKVDIPLYSMEPNGLPTTSIAPVNLTTTTTAAPVTPTTAPEMTIAPEALGRILNNPPGGDPTNLAATGFATLQVFGIGMILTGLGLALYWFGGPLRRDLHLLLIPSSRNRSW